MKYAFKKFEFKEVAYVGWANNRLILSPKYIIGEKEFSDIIFIYEGKCTGANKMSHILTHCMGGQISEADYESGTNRIMDECNVWCRNLGLPEITEKI